ncbi:MAG: hypothetical protein AB8H79_19450 [Myxococcota bacterium]
MNGFFSDKRRFWVLGLLCTLWMADAGIWTWHTLTRPGTERVCLTRPGICAGQEGALPLQVVYEITGPNAYVVGRPHGRIAVRGSTAGLSVGQEVSLGGQFTEEGLRADWVETHPLRPWKRRLGLAGLLALLGVLLLTFTLRKTESGWRVVHRG